MKTITIKLLSILFFIHLPTLTYGVDPDEILKDSKLEKIAREISKELRCVVCQNQSIDDSDAKLAKDLRKLVRQRLMSGDDRDMVLKYVVSRYGEFVLLNPPIKIDTLLLWLGPLIIIFIGIALIFIFFKNKMHPSTITEEETTPLNNTEEKKVQKILKDLKQ